MSFPRDTYPYTNFHELNLGYFIVHFREIFSQWADLYDQMLNWKDATDEELATWKAGVEADLDQREAALRAELETWKAQTGQDIAGWEDATLAALTAWQTATQAVFEAIRVEAAGSASAAAASAGDAATAKTAAETAQAAAEAAAASVQASASQITTNTEDIADLKTQITDIQKDLYTDLLIGKNPIDDLFIDPATGEERTLISFYSYKNLDIPTGVTILFPYNGISENARSIRSTCFYDSNGDFISGVGGTESTVNNGITVPNNAVKVNVTLAYLDATAKTKAKHYLSTIKNNIVQLKTENVAGLDAELTEVNNNISSVDNKADSIDAKVNNIVIDEHSDLLYNKTIVNNKFCDPATGEIRNLYFYTVLNIELPEGVEKLFPYNANDENTHALRSVCFYNSTTQDTTTFISGQSGTAASVINGITVPDNAVSIAVSIGNTPLENEYYLSTKRGGDFITKILNNDIKVNKNQIIGFEDTLKEKFNNYLSPVQLENRKPSFSFIFDDGNTSDADLKTLFDNYGFKCGFALIGETTSLSTRKDRYLQYQDEGFEILSHSVNGTAFSTVTDLAVAEQYLKNSLDILKEAGFDVKGWVTPSSWSLETQMPLICKYYQYGYGHLSGTPEHVNYHPFYGKDIRQLDRWSLEGNTISDTMEQINAAISANAYMIFYGHTYPGTDNNFTVENMNTILTFLRGKVDSGDVIVGTPRETVNNFYSFRHSDLLTLYNSLS